MPSSEDYARVVAWMVLLMPLTLCGIWGISDALLGRRRSALRSGLIAGLPGLGSGLWVFGDVLSRRDELIGAGPIAVILAGSLPLLTGIWAVLLALLVPAKPPGPDSPSC